VAATSGLQRAGEGHHVQSLPAPRVAELAAACASRRPAESVATEPGTETILLVEDEANLRYLARQFLEKQGYRVIDAADGAVAVQIAVAHEV